MSWLPGEFPRCIDKTKEQGIDLIVTPQFKYYLAPVSYTHLDVYKRQILAVKPKRQASFIVHEIGLQNTNDMQDNRNECKDEPIQELSLIHI